MQRPGRHGSTRRTKTNLSRFGRWVEALNIILGINQVELARLAFLSKSTLSYATRDGEGDAEKRPTRETINALTVAYERLADEQEIPLPRDWQSGFALAAWFEEEKQVAISDLILAALEARARLVEEVEHLAKQLEDVKKQNRQLRIENRQLRKQQRP